MMLLTITDALTTSGIKLLKGGIEVNPGLGEQLRTEGTKHRGPQSLNIMSKELKSGC